MAKNLKKAVPHAAKSIDELLQKAGMRQAVIIMTEFLKARDWARSQYKELQAHRISTQEYYAANTEVKRWGERMEQFVEASKPKPVQCPCCKGKGKIEHAQA